MNEKSSELVKYLRKALPTIHRLTLTKLVDEQVNEMIDILQTFASYCIIDEEMKEPNTVNQNILYTNGTFFSNFCFF